MSDKEAAKPEGTSGKPDKSGPDDVKAAKAVGADQVQEKMDEEHEKGYYGTDEDPLKPDGYTVQGSTARAEESKL